MLKKQTNILLLLILGIALVASLLYAVIRSTQTAHLQQQLHALKSKEVRFGTTMEDAELLKTMFPAQPDTSSFVEKLYSIAQSAGLQNVEITTSTTAVPKTSRKSDATRDTASMLVPYHVKIACEGNYHAVALYFKQIHDMQRYSKVVSFSMKPDKHTVKANILVEIVSFEVPNAS